jgi:hypothetical protein
LRQPPQRWRWALRPWHKRGTTAILIITTTIIMAIITIIMDMATITITTTGIVTAVAFATGIFTGTTAMLIATGTGMCAATTTITERGFVSA